MGKLEKDNVAPFKSKKQIEMEKRRDTAKRNLKEAAKKLDW